ncbi:3-hydroxyacyl-ACP dehydratase FabZ family protein [Micromonospora sp. CPCC 206061]|uniref:3-hydroxyacyl-ACP dehydratase FabZ family protein n=1 Tax=Micromonospora sp. CPCC 206061 TaxID=3122410 RepID=UPI002FF316B0
MSEQSWIRTLLPQRYPLLLVDRVVSLVPELSICALKAVTVNEPCYAGMGDGAAPADYAYPVSLMLESLGQTAALLWLRGQEPAATASVLLFAGVRDYRVEGGAFPGDVLRHHVEIERVVAETAFARGETWIGDRRVAQVDTLIAARRPRADLAGRAARPT